MFFSGLETDTPRARRRRRPTALITGAGSGLGFAMAERLLAEGWNLILCDINCSKCEPLKERAQAKGSQLECMQLDVGVASQWETVVQEARQRFAHLDLLVNNAGVGASGEIGTLPIAKYEKLLQVNLFGVVYGCHYCVPWLKENPDRAHILNIASIAAICCAPAMSAYNVSKASDLSSRGCNYKGMP